MKEDSKKRNKRGKEITKIRNMQINGLKLGNDVSPLLTANKQWFNYEIIAKEIMNCTQQEMLEFELVMKQCYFTVIL